MYNQSVMLKNKINFEDLKDDALLTWNDVDYHKFIQYRINSILTLKCALEFFVNQVIPDDYVVDNQNKDAITTNFTLKDKIESVVATAIGYNLEENRTLIDDILKVTDLAKEILNMKANNSSLDQPFLDLFAEITNLDLKHFIEQAKLFLKTNGFEVMPID